MTRWFSLHAVKSKQASAREATPDQGDRSFEPATAENDQVLAQSVSLDQEAAADLADSEADANLPVVAPLTDGRLIDVARTQASW